MENLALFIILISRLLIFIIFMSSLLSFILSPYHPLREALGRITNPLLEPIRRLMPATGMVDFSPMILIILIVLVTQLLISVLRSM
jgi:YggT family protein